MMPDVNKHRWPFAENSNLLWITVPRFLCFTNDTCTLHIVENKSNTFIYKVLQITNTHMEYKEMFDMRHFPKIPLVKKIRWKCQTFHSQTQYFVNSSYKRHINKLVQWQLPSGRTPYHYKIVYYGIVTPLLQQNTFLLCNQSVMTVKNMLINIIWSCECRTVADQSAISWGDWLTNVSLVYVYDRRKVYDCLQTSRQQVGDQSATNNCARIVCNHCDLSETSCQPIADQSPTSMQPLKTFIPSIWSQRCFTCSKRNLIVTKSSLRHMQPVGDQSATALWPLCKPPTIARNNACKEVADRLQAMLLRGSVLVPLKTWR